MNLNYKNKAYIKYGAHNQVQHDGIRNQESVVARSRAKS